jgi:hypothetical protein
MVKCAEVQVNDKEHLYRFTILYCAAPPANVFGPA